MNPKEVSKIFTTVESRVTLMTLPTRHRDSFCSFLERRKIKPDRPVQTEVWNGVESSLTEFSLPLSMAMTRAIFDDWLTEA
jgi:hypothetical protein